MSTLIDRAKFFAEVAHAGQTRKYSDDPYITHPIRVSEIVAHNQGTDEMIAAALLHDVVEDTPVTHDEILDKFGANVSDLVFGLTDVDLSKGNRKTRKALDRDRIASSSADVQLIKLADFIDNTTSIVQHDPSFAKLYLQEKSQMLDVMDKVKDHPLFRIANSQINL
jgi:(p)ppGpp synthase/HD superfamily hydrolase